MGWIWLRKLLKMSDGFLKTLFRGNAEKTLSKTVCSKKLTFDPKTIFSDAIDEAITELELLEMAAKPNLEGLVKRGMREGFRAVATAHRKDGPQLDKSEKKELGIRANAFMSRQAASELTEKGMESPLEAHFLTLWRADFTIDRARHLLNASQHDFGRIDVINGGHVGCTICETTSKSTFDPCGISPFPPKGCSNAGCNRMFVSFVDYAAARKSKMRG